MRKQIMYIAIDENAWKEQLGGHDPNANMQTLVSQCGVRKPATTHQPQSVLSITID